MLFLKMAPPTIIEPPLSPPGELTITYSFGAPISFSGPFTHAIVFLENSVDELLPLDSPPLFASHSASHPNGGRVSDVISRGNALLDTEGGPVSVPTLIFSL